MDLGGLDPAALGGIGGAGAILLGGLLWWCKRRYEIHIVKQRRMRRWKAQQTLVVPTLTPRPVARVVGRTQMKTLVAKTRTPIILRDPLDKNGSGSIPINLVP